MMDETSSVYRHAFDQVVADLVHRYEGEFTREKVAELVAERRAQLEAANRHQEFIPALVENWVNDHLLARREAQLGTFGGVAQAS